MKYDELIKQLRSTARFAEYGMTIPQSYLVKAADAIEDLQAKYQILLAEYVDLMEKPKEAEEEK